MVVRRSGPVRNLALKLVLLVIGSLLLVTGIFAGSGNIENLEAVVGKRDHSRVCKR